MRVLFVGSSYLFFNDLPGLLSRLAAVGGVTLETESVAHGGMTLLGHLRLGEALARLRSGGWDAVVLQEQSTRPIYAPAIMRAAARPFAAESAGIGARLALLLTWARHGHGEQQAALNDSYYGTTRALGASVAPAGPAWQRARAERPALVLHRPDGTHPAPAGTYLAACVLFAVLTGRSPTGLSERTVQAGDGGESSPVTLAEEEAVFLQRMAWETVAAAPDPSAWPGTAWPGDVADDVPTRAGPDLDGEVDLDANLDVALLQEVPLLHGLTAAQVHTVLATVGRTRLSAGTTIYASGEEAQASYVALDGVLGITPDGGTSAAFDLGRMGLALAFGTEVSLGEPHRASASAVTDVTLLAIRPADLDALAAHEPALAADLRYRIAAV